MSEIDLSKIRIDPEVLRRWEVNMAEYIADIERYHQEQIQREHDEMAYIWACDHCDRRKQKRATALKRRAMWHRRGK